MTTADLVANAPVITIDLAALAVAPDTTPNEMPPGPQQAEAEPEPEPDPKSRSRRNSNCRRNRRPSRCHGRDAAAANRREAEREKAQADSTRAFPARRAPPRQGRACGSADARRLLAQSLMQCRTGNRSWSPSWSATSAIRPRRARAASKGVAQLAFSVDRRGGVHHARIVRSSGSSVLDRATLALVGARAPLPPPPPEITR